MQITENMFNSAVKELKGLFLEESVKLCNKGMTYKLTDNAPESFMALKNGCFCKNISSLSLRTKDTMAYTGGEYVSIKGENVKVSNKIKVIPIANYGSSLSMYGEYSNTLFRFWHDALHLEMNESFSMEGEERVAIAHMSAAKAANLSNIAIALLKFDTIGQVQYYYNHKEFVINQEAFVRSCVQHGMKLATRIKH